MRIKFENILKDYNETIKDSVKDLSKEGRNKTKEEIKSKTDFNAGEENNSPEVQGRIYDIQKTKQNILNKMHKNLAKIDKHEELNLHDEEKQVYKLEYDHKNKQIVYKTSHGENITVMPEEVLTDGQWGLNYNLDQKIDRILQKEYVFTESKRKIANLANEQIAINKISNNYIGTGKQTAYRELLGREGKQVENVGVLAEKMINNFLQKISIKNKELFEIIPADFEDDVEEKIDFIIKRGSKKRGVDVETDDEIKAVQLTLNPKAVEHKNEQIAKSTARNKNMFDELALVVLPSEEIKKSYKEWKILKRPGGPDKLLPKEFKIEIFQKIMENILTKEEIGEICKEI